MSTDTITLPITHDPDDAPRIGDAYVHEGRERIIVDRAYSDDGATVTLWFSDATVAPSRASGEAT